MKLISAEALRDLLDKKGVSYADLGRSAGVSKGFVSHLTAGRRTTCKPLVAYRIAERLDVPVSVLFEVRVPTSVSENVTHRKAAA